jgi:hypothetical protein
VNVAWTFRSRHVPGNTPQALPLSAVRFAPPVNRDNTAPAGTVLAIPLTVQRQPGSLAGRARTLTVEVSYDDGATWSDADVRRHGQHGVASLRHPAGAGFVSLRASSTDETGNTVSQTVIRAYRIA